MFVREMTRPECIALVTASHIGRLACARDDQPYIVPIQYAFTTGRLYGFSMPGQKIDWMRDNAKVCVQIDEFADRESWKSVVIYGSYRDCLTRTRRIMNAFRRGHFWRSGSTGGSRAD